MYHYHLFYRTMVNSNSKQWLTVLVTRVYLNLLSYRGIVAGNMPIITFLMRFDRSQYINNLYSGRSGDCLFHLLNMFSWASLLSAQEV